MAPLLWHGPYQGTHGFFLPEVFLQHSQLAGVTVKSSIRALHPTLGTHVLEALWSPGVNMVAVILWHLKVLTGYRKLLTWGFCLKATDKAHQEKAYVGTRWPLRGSPTMQTLQGPFLREPRALLNPWLECQDLCEGTRLWASLESLSALCTPDSSWS